MTSEAASDRRDLRSQGRVGSGVDWAKRPRSCGTEICQGSGSLPGCDQHAYDVWVFDSCVYLQVVWESGAFSLAIAVPLIESLKSKTT